MPNDFFNDIKDKDILFSFEGVVTRPWLDTFYHQLDSNFENQIEDVKLKKRVNYILLESLQNLFHHAEKMQVDAQHENHSASRCVVYRMNENDFRIVTENVILNSQIDTLQHKIDFLNSMSCDQLKIYYQEMLNKNQMSAKGGAGLGLIEMARKSGKQIEYSFQKMDDKLSRFSLAITISSSKN